jgi:putative ABC transport system permease protein
LYIYDLIVYQSNVDLSVGASRLGVDRLSEIRRVPGVQVVGPIGTASAALILGDDRKPLNVALIGVEPGLPGEPPALKGAGLRSRRSKEAVIDRQTALRAGRVIQFS